MENRHLIAKQVFELRVGFNQAQVPQLQDAFSQHYWQSVAPALEKLFDRLVGADELVRVERLELDVGRWSTEDIMSGRFVEGLMLRLETVIADALRGTGTHVDVLPMRIGQFDLWLYFLEHGYLSGAASHPDSPQEWQQSILESLSTDEATKYSLRNLLLRYPAALERLIRQHDVVFLNQLLNHFSGHKQRDLAGLVNEVVDSVIRALIDASDHLRPEELTPAESEKITVALFDWLNSVLASPVANHPEATLKQRITALFDREASSPAALAQSLLQVDSWRAVLEGVVATEMVGHLARQAAAILSESSLLQQLARTASPAPLPPASELERRIELAAWWVLCDEAVIKGNDHYTATLLKRVIRTDALLPWQGQLIRALDSRAGERGNSRVWTDMAEAINALPAATSAQRQKTNQVPGLDKETDTLLVENATQSSPSDAAETDMFYVQAVGVILLHPFLPRLFEKLQLCEGGAFIDEASQQRAVCLIHHLATGELRTPEYKLVLPKFLCGMPLNAPLDHFIEISGAEQDECENLMAAAIGHWGALGNSSPDWLREVFFQRDGKLEKRETGWQLRVERKAQDILLDRLPHGWGLGMVKLPWMDELLRIDW